MTGQQRAALHQAVQRGLENASLSLSQMINRHLHIEVPAINLVPLEQVSVLAGAGGVEQNAAVAVYLGITGDIQGHIVLFLSQQSAGVLVDFLLEQPAGTTQQLDDMALSALGEVGNVTGASVLNTLANETGLVIVPSTPTVLLDMADAVLNSVLAALSMAGDQALVVETFFGSAIGAAGAPPAESETVQGHFFLLPELDSLTTLLGALR